MSQTLTQVQIIQSLADALSWFEKELSWGVSSGEMNHLTGRIGELYTAMVTRGQMAMDTNQHGYDVISAENERVSVKTITTSNHVSFNPNTFDQVDRVIVLRINISDEDGLSIEELYDLSVFEARKLAATGTEALRISISNSKREKRPLDELRVTDVETFGTYEVRRYENGTIKVKDGGDELAIAKPVLREIADSLGVDIFYGDGQMKNTRLLGSHILKALKNSGD